MTPWAGGDALVHGEFRTWEIRGRRLGVNGLRIRLPWRRRFQITVFGRPVTNADIERVIGSPL